MISLETGTLPDSGAPVAAGRAGAARTPFSRE
jgi:hypothetical protein